MAQSNTTMVNNFAIIKTGGKQYKVKAGDRLKVEKIEAAPKKEIVFEDLLSGKKVSASVVSTGKLPKVRILKFKPKKRYKRNLGHRQPYSEILIEKIS